MRANKRYLYSQLDDLVFRIATNEIGQEDIEKAFILNLRGISIQEYMTGSKEYLKQRYIDNELNDVSFEEFFSICENIAQSLDAMIEELPVEWEIKATIGPSYSNDLLEKDDFIKDTITKRMINDVTGQNIGIFDKELMSFYKRNFPESAEIFDELRELRVTYLDSINSGEISKSWKEFLRDNGFYEKHSDIFATQPEIIQAEDTQPFLFQEQLDAFKEVYLSDSYTEELKNGLQNVSFPFTKESFIEQFSPRTATEKFLTSTNNNQWHLHGRSLFGIEGAVRLTEEGIKRGFRINSGEYQIDRTNFLAGDARIKELFIAKAQDMEEEAKELLNMSNENMIRKFNIKATNSQDACALLCAVISDSIIDTEIKNNNFKDYGHCWNDHPLVSIDNKDGSSSSIRGEMDIKYPITVELSNGEKVEFRSSIKKGENSQFIGIDDMVTEVISVEGNSELLQAVVSQIDRFSDRTKKEAELMGLISEDVTLNEQLKMESTQLKQYEEKDQNPKHTEPRVD